MSMSGVDRRVANKVEAAAEHARAGAAIATAAELIRHALAITPHDAVNDKVRRAVLAADWLSTIGEVQQARQCLDPLTRNLPPGNERARCLLALSWTQGQEVHESLAIIDEALAQPSLRPELEAELHLERAGALEINGDLVGAYGEASAAASVASGIPDDNLVARAATASVQTELFLGRTHPGSFGWPVDTLMPIRSESVYHHPGRLRAWVASWADDNATAAEIFASLVDQAHQAGDVYSEGGLSLHGAEVAVRQGRLGQAAGLAALGYRLQSDGINDQFPLYVQAHIAACAGNTEAAVRLASEGLRMARRAGDVIFAVQNLLVLAFASLSTGDHAAASRYSSELETLVEGMRWGHPGTYRWHADAVEAHLGIGLLDAATSVTSTLWEQADRLHLRGSQAIAARCQGLIHAHNGDTKTALECLEQSLSLLDSLDVPFEQGRTLLTLGMVRRRSRQKATARAALEQARETFANIEFRLWTQRADRELARAGGAAGGTLTSSERAIATLAATGATNQEIADRLFLSPRTVETVLTRVYRKIGVRSRTQLARHFD
ncbi:hypothetical protein Afe04nite_70060 [Asanoa ferruginea]|nr:hypothetical protein Afe04nite_70060 [Asanoa ferruginea]